MPDAKTDFGTNIPAKIANSADPKSVNAIFCFKITGDGGGVWTVDLKENPGVREGDEGKADCTLEIAAADWTSISGNPGAAMQLYLTGKLKVSGNAMLATKLQSILA
jgi:putative sterol carrier protein